MDRVFSVDEITEHFWSPPIHVSGDDESSKMTRSASEWAFQRFLQEASVSATSPPSSSPLADVDTQSKPTTIASIDAGVLSNGHPHPPVVAVDSEEYRAVLKSKLNLACAAVAMTRVFTIFPFTM